MNTIRYYLGRALWPVLLSFGIMLFIVPLQITEWKARRIARRTHDPNPPPLK